ncbi:MAG: DUF3465 domain-containing protein [Planctomycetota bacterium]
MTETKSKQPVTLKSLLALVGAGLLYLVSQLLGIDLTGSKAGAGDEAVGSGAPTAPADPGQKNPSQKNPIEKSPAPKQETPTKPAPKAPAAEPSEPSKPSEPSGPPAPEAPEVAKRRDDTKLIQQLFRTMVSDRIVEAEGKIVHILPLDNEGSRHQNFLVELTNGLTLKISHNIDLAPQLPITKGDTIRFHGEYEYNEKGGVVHWTHRDPAGRHEHGWLEHKGKKYE